MKSSGNKEQIETQQKYVFFSNPETIAKRAETSARILQNQQFAQLRKQQDAKQVSSGNLINPPSASNLKNLESFLVHKPVQPYPFTFITAVKRKLALAAYNETSKKLYYSGNTESAQPLDVQMNNIDASSKESLYQTVQKMDFIKPLKVPDVKISPKTLDYSPKDASNLRDVNPLKFSLASQKVDKTPKSMERAHRKLDFSLSEGHSLISSDDIEPLKAPDLSISPSLSKKKDHTRDNSREKENRTKRIKKDDSIVPKVDDMPQDCTKRTKNPKHVSRKDVVDSKRSKNERMSYLPKECDSTSKKPKNKNLAISTAKKDEEKRLRSSSIHSIKSSRDKSLESRGRTFSSESLSDRNFKLHEKLARECSRATDSDVSALKYNDDYQILNALRQLEEQKLKVMENKTPKMPTRSSQPIQQKSLEVPPKEQHKRILDRTKASTSKSQARAGSSTSEILEELETVSDSNGNKNRNVYTEISQQSKTKNPISCQANSNIESQNVTQTSSDDILLDPTKISFRDDSYSQQEEFCDLVTPDINLTLRSKRRKPIASENDSEPELKTPKHKPTRVETPQNIEQPLLHPTALHMQFQAELHLFDSYNESLRQVMDVEKCLYTVKHDKGKELLQKQRLANEEIKKQLTAMTAERDRETFDAKSPFSDESPDGKSLEDGNVEKNTFGNLAGKSDLQEQEEESRNHVIRNKDFKPDVKVAEVQTQTANDIATQTDTRLARHTVAERLKQYPGITYDRGSLTNCDIPELSLGSFEQFEDLDHIEDISLPSKMRTMSEISLHETTSSIKTETGTEISISTRDVTCSFNKYLDLEMAQLIKDEKLMYDKIEMLFKSREKTLNDRTRKLVKLEEQKRQLRDTGQDSRISSVKKKQRALLLKLQQEKDEMNRLKELHKMASQERKLMLQKQRNMFNPQMSTKNILTKLKRSADCQSPRRLSGPMKGYDIRSNSSMSSLVDSDKSQLDRSQIDLKLQLSDSSHRLEGKSLKSDFETSAAEKLDASKNRKYMSVLEESANSLNNLDQLNDFISSFETPQKLESKTRKFEEKMPSLKTNYLGRTKHTVPLNHGQIIEMTEGSKVALQNVDNSENVKSESDTLVEELSKKSKSQALDSQVSVSLKESPALEIIHGEADSTNSRKSKASQVTEESLLINYKGTKKSEKIVAAEKKQHPHESKSANKRKGSKNLKAKSTSEKNILTENILRSKGNTHTVDDIIKPVSKRTKADKEAILPDDNYQSSILEEIDLNESQNSLQALVKHSRAIKDKNYKLLRDIASEHETKENILTRNVMERSADNRDNNTRRDEADIQNLGNISTRSQVSTFTISRHSSGDSEKSFSRSVVIRAQDHRFKTSKKLEQVLNAREAALTTRRNCVEDWIAWHTKLKAEESRVARMEQAAFKLVSTTANALPYHDTTMSSDTSDVEGRVELLAEKLAERRAEMAKLKREARRQAKQRLKALEATLLSQIKKYDTTIHEMRKKLETQKTVVKDSDKLAIESRSVADFKVPEIPIKRIQEIYKSSDLLRSRSESDLIFSKVSHEDPSRNAYPTDYHDKSKENIYKSSSSLDNKTSRLSRLSSAREGRTNQSAEFVLEEAKNFAYSNSEKHSEISSRESQRISESRSEESAVSEELTNLHNSATSTVNIQESLPDQTNTRKSEIISEISEIQTAATEENSKMFSRKLETLQLTNKNLNDDISTLENDLKALSEMMSHFGKKSDDKLKIGSAVATEQDEIGTVIDSVTKNTSKDISEQLSQSVHSELPEEFSKITEDLEQPISLKTGDSIPEQSSILPEIERSEKSGLYEELEVDVTKAMSVIMTDGKSEKSGLYEELEADVTEVMSVIIPDGKSAETKTTEEIDFEARSKEILNVIEKSIISEHVKSPQSDLNVSSAALEESMKDMQVENEALSQDLNSLEGDIKSISKIISEMAESKRNIELAANLSSAAYTIEESLEPKEHSFEMPVLQLDNENQEFEVSEHESRDVLTGNDKLEQAVNSPKRNSEIEDKFTYLSPRENPVESSSDILAKFENLNEPANDILAERKDQDERVVNDTIRPTESEKSVQIDDEEAESIAEELSASQQDDLYNESSLVSRKSSEASQDKTNESSLENSGNNEEFKETEGISIGKASIENDWTISDSFQVPEKSGIADNEWKESLQPEEEITIEPSDFSPLNLTEESRHSLENRNDTENFTCDMEDVSMFIPKGESTTIGYKFEESAMDITKNEHIDELDDILDIIARESKQTTESYRDSEPEIASKPEEAVQINLEQLSGIPATISDRIVPRPSDLNLTAEVEPVLQKLTEILQGVERNIARRRRSGNDVENRDNTEIKTVSPISTISSVHSNKALSAETNESEEKVPELESYVLDEIIPADHQILHEFDKSISSTRVPEEIQTEIALQDNLQSLRLNPEDFETVKITEPEIEEDSAPKPNERTFEVFKGPEYEDISEESLEVSEILDRSESQRSLSSAKATKIPEKYEMTQKSEDVLRILDAISQQSYAAAANKQQQHLHDVQISVQVFGSISPGFTTKKDSPTNDEPLESSRAIVALDEHKKSTDNDRISSNDKFNEEEQLPEEIDSSRMFSRATKVDDEICRKEQDSSESSEGADTPRGVSEIEMDSPRDPNESRLDIDALDDDLLGGNENAKTDDDGKVDFHGAPVIATSEKDIEMMIDKLKASLEQPGLEVAELEAKLLRIEQLQIELEIKKLEAEEVSFYVREIPNKPPPPYTPPGGVGRLSTPQVSPTLPPAVVPSNVEELTAFTEKATVLIFNAKNAGEDIMSLQPPAEICELSKDNNETAKQDRRIYNTFLFDLCKETIAELYRSEYEKPGPSWTKPNVKTKPAMKIPKTVEELNEYVSKEVATLFGFKTKLQRENMVMRWSRKRRDRVDELLAREAQAEEDEWTKFHHDELAVKNELTVAILDTLILETTSVVKAVYAKKRKVMV